MTGMPSHQTSFLRGTNVGVFAGGVAEVSEALAGDAVRYTQAALSHAPDLSQMLQSIAAYLV